MRGTSRTARSASSGSVTASSRWTETRPRRCHERACERISKHGAPANAAAERPRGGLVSWLETLRTGLGAVLSHRLRSGLTMLGILIGIAAVILTVGFGEGAQAKVGGEINALGSNLLVVSPGSATASTGIRGGFGSASTLTEADATALASKTVAPDVAAVAPATQRSETLTATGTNWTTTVVGTTPDWLSVRARSVTEGRFLTQADENADAAVAVLGATTAEELFGLRDPVGQTVTVNGLPLTVIGVLNTVGASASSATTNLDDQ